MIKKCSRCGLRMQTHTSAKCNEILFQERNVLLEALTKAVGHLDDANQDARKALRWVTDRQAQDAVENDPLLR